MKKEGFQYRYRLYLSMTFISALFQENLGFSFTSDSVQTSMDAQSIMPPRERVSVYGPCHQVMTCSNDPLALCTKETYANERDKYLYEKQRLRVRQVSTQPLSDSSSKGATRQQLVRRRRQRGRTSGDCNLETKYVLPHPILLAISLFRFGCISL